MTLGCKRRSLPAAAPTWARLPDRVPLDRPDGADSKPPGDCNGAGVSGDCARTCGPNSVAAHGALLMSSF